MIDTRLAYGLGLLVGAATATAAWVRLAGHPPVKAASRAQLAAIQACIRALEALPTREWDDDESSVLTHAQGMNSLAPTACPCRDCLAAAGVRVWWMVTCDLCGNKRCPHTDDHRNVCTRSNEPGQTAGPRFDNGGVVPPGLSTVYNSTGRPEYLGPDDEDGTPQRRGQDGPLAPRDPATGTPGGSEPARPAQAHTGRSGAVTTGEAG